MQRMPLRVPHPRVVQILGYFGNLVDGASRQVLFPISIPLLIPAGAVYGTG
jgi:hypothetical protein